MPNDNDSGTAQPQTGIKILRANNVEVPATTQPEDPELAKLRSAFFAGEKLEPEQLSQMMLASVSSRNGNCNIC